MNDLLELGVAILTRRAELMVRLLGDRERLLTEIAGLGGVANVKGIERVKTLEGTLRDLDEALGILRYGTATTRGTA